MSKNFNSENKENNISAKRESQQRIIEDEDKPPPKDTNIKEEKRTYNYSNWKIIKNGKAREIECTVNKCYECSENYHNEIKRNEKIDNRDKFSNGKKPKHFKNHYCIKSCIFCKNFIARYYEWLQEQLIDTAPDQKSPEISNQKQIEKMKNINIAELSPNEVTEEIKLLKAADFQKIKIKSDGNCLYRALLTSANQSETNHFELRQLVADTINNMNNEERKFTELDELFMEQNCKNNME